jgi:hypothetical protein
MAYVVGVASYFKLRRLSSDLGTGVNALVDMSCCSNSIFPTVVDMSVNWQLSNFLRTSVQKRLLSRTMFGGFLKWITGYSYNP